MKALDSNGNIISDRNKARMEYLKTNLSFNSGEVFGFTEYGHGFLDISDDQSLINTIEALKKTMVDGSDLAIDKINRKVQGVVSITFKGDNQNEIKLEDNYGTN